MEPSLTFDPDVGLGGHKDLSLRFAGQALQCDIYFFAIDHGFRPDDGDLAKVVASLGRLFEQWLEALRTVKAGENAYLPYDFSDQYTGWLRCTRVDEGFDVVAGWCEVEGWRFSPTQIGQRLYHLDDFRTKGPTVRMSTADLEAAILESAAKVAALDDHI